MCRSRPPGCFDNANQPREPNDRSASPRLRSASPPSRAMGFRKDGAGPGGAGLGGGGGRRHVHFGAAERGEGVSAGALPDDVGIAGGVASSPGLPSMGPGSAAAKNLADFAQFDERLDEIPRSIMQVHACMPCVRARGTHTQPWCRQAPPLWPRFKQNM